jgi:hypothetical protein
MFILYLKAEFGSFCFISDGGLRAVLPQPLVQKSFYNLQNFFFPQNFPATQTVVKIKQIQTIGGKCIIDPMRNEYHYTA